MTIPELLKYYMGKDTEQRQKFIIDNLTIEDESQAANAAETMRKRKQVCRLRSIAKYVNSFAHLELIEMVGGMADTCSGLATDTYLSFCNEAEGVVSVESKADFPVWFNAGWKSAELDGVEVTKARSAAVAEATLVLRNVVWRDGCDYLSYKC